MTTLLVQDRDSLQLEYYAGVGWDNTVTNTMYVKNNEMFQTNNHFYK